MELPWLLDAVFLFTAASFVFIICIVAQRRAAYDTIEEQHSSTKCCKKLRTPELTILFAFLAVFCIYVLIRSSQLSRSQLAKNHPATSRTILAPGIEWHAENNGVFWGFNCDWDNYDLYHVTISPSLCGPICVANNNCTHFTASDGECYLKSATSPLTAITASGATVCGWVQRGDNGIGRVYYNVKTTCHQATEVGSCRLPREAYSLHTPLALGDIPELQDLRFQGSLCGHILKVDCGHGPISVIVTNSNPGGGLDLYKSSWDAATAGVAPGELGCSVQFTLKNPLQAGGYRCYFASGETNNQYYHNVGLLNTEGRMVSGSVLKGVRGTPSGSDGYYTFTNQATRDDEIWFNFTDGGSYSVVLRDCVQGGNYEMWN